MSRFADLTDVYLEVDGQVSLSRVLVSQVNDLCARVEEDADKDLTVLVRIDGTRAAGSGEPWPHETAVHLVNQWERALRRLERLPAVVLAVASGVDRGPALDLLLATDYRLATGDLRVETVDMAGGAWPGMVLYRLVTQVGLATARRMTLLGQPVAADRAVATGLVDEITDDALTQVRLALHTLGGQRGKELAIRRQLLFEAATTSFEDALGAHLAACDRALRLARRGPDAAPAAGTRL